ncbi:type IV toxin-antitoxin system AbiEi family antitoxin domain-containing protein [Kordiimonas pumila]|uniref:AbiEi antitoxin N-terminal domain-containing protein n=1 Tax=Kordiimonas pumila TaxID=2161677 RepID=A0ABV7D682_9PROT|nr:AbiEi antitoxin N-terminal domain-containing protein [Kordiimonas pumila]
MTELETQKDHLISILQDQTVVRARDLRSEGIAASTVARAVKTGDIIKIDRGLYQLQNGQVHEEQALAEVSKRVPNGTICMMSALAFHGVTDQIPAKTWVAIGPKDWAPKITYPPIRFVRFQKKYLHYGIEFHMIGGVKVPVYSISKTLADAFRNPKLLDRSVAIEAMKNALEARKVTPSGIAEAASVCGAWKKIRPYLEAITSNG